MNRYVHIYPKPKNRTEQKKWFSSGLDHTNYPSYPIFLEPRNRNLTGTELVPKFLK